MTKRDRQAVEYATEHEGDVSEECKKRYRVTVTNQLYDGGVSTYMNIGIAREIDGGCRYYVANSAGYLEPADGWHTSEAAALRDAAGRVAEIHGAISAQLARLLRGGAMNDRDHVAELQHVAETCRGEGQDDGPGDGWRWLAPGEVLQRGDEYWSDEYWSDARPWTPTEQAGRIVDEAEDRRYRRRAAAPPQPPAAGVGTVEAVAEVVYEAMRFDRNQQHCRPAPPWAAGANSLAQEEARDAARKILSVVQPPAAGVTLTDAERELLRSLIPSVHPHSFYTVTLSPDERKTAHGLLARLGGDA